MRRREPNLVVSKTEFARLAGVSKGAVTNAIPRGLLVATDDGKIDTEHPLAARYLADHAEGRREHAPVQAAKKAPAKRAIVPPPPGMVGGDVLRVGAAILAGAADPTAGVALRDKRTIADIELKRIMRRKHELDIATKKGQLIPRDLVRQELAELDAALKTNLRDLPRRVAAQIHAIALADGPRGVEAALEREIGAAIERAKVLPE